MLLEAILTMGILALISAVGLAIASKKFHVQHDKRIDTVRDALPSYNCGACGYGTCDNYAKAVVLEKAETSKCAPGGQEVADKVAHIMGETVCYIEPKVAQLHCDGGTNNCQNKSDYKGIKTCRAANLVNGGPKKCTYACIGFGDCVLVCPVDAITLDENDLPVVDKETCIYCGKCVNICPKHLYELVPNKKKVHVLCSSKDVGKDVIKVCKVGCIACFACERACPVEGLAIHVIDNLAILDYDKCIMCGKCVQACPRKIIIDERKQ